MGNKDGREEDKKEEQLLLQESLHGMEDRTRYQELTCAENMIARIPKSRQQNMVDRIEHTM